MHSMHSMVVDQKDEIENEKSNETDYSIHDEYVFANKLHLDISWVVKQEWATTRYVKHTPIRFLHPSDSEKRVFNYKMKGNISLHLIELFDTIFKYDNSIAFHHITRRFGLGISKRKCENLIKKIINHNCINIMESLIAMNIDLTQGDHLPIRYAKSVQKQKLLSDEMVALLTKNGGTIGLEQSISRFQNYKPKK